MKQIRVILVALALAVGLAVPVLAMEAYNPPLNWWALPDLAMFGGYGETTMDNLVQVRDRWNIARKIGGVFAGVPSVYITYDKALGGSILVTNESPARMVVNANGDYLIYKAQGDAPAVQADPADPDYNKWVDARSVSNEKIVLSYTSLSDLAKKLNTIHGISCQIVKNGSFYMITRNSNQIVYCNLANKPYVASADPSATDINFDIIVDNSKNNSDNIVLVDSKVIDNTTNTLNVVNELGQTTQYDIESLYYNSETNQYTANTYLFDDHSQTYNYYTWNITYNIQNTYINYIGSNVGYEQEEYKYYYQLPDGRSSEDLTAEEVSAMSFQFYDALNYSRSATDTSLRALYHFDGNLEDSGYFSTQTSFKWVSNASIQYMDSATFGGALYLDERVHDFDIQMPSNFGSGDFTIQWRHYQASERDTISNIENRLALGGITVLRWDDSDFYIGSSSTTSVATIPIGSWHELALIRKDGVLRFYVNGLSVWGAVDATVYTGQLLFSFGKTSRAYSMIDELRVLNSAIVSSGSYQCTTVPYDTNLVLVLPDSAFPIADEYWEFNSVGNLITGYDFTQMRNPDAWRIGTKTTFLSDGDYSTITGSFTQAELNEWTQGYYSNMYLYGYTRNISSLTVGKQYTFSIYRTDGTYDTLTFNMLKANENIHHVKSFPWGVLVIHPYSGGVYITIMVKSGMSLDLRYAELLEGNQHNVGHEKVSCVYSSEEMKPNTVAVQTAIPLAGYTVGGVRPTFPVRGDVWFPVSGSRITGVYVYDGSMWLVAGARYYTGSRWIPIYAFDIYTLMDCWDVADAEDVTPPIATEYDFWNWWKKEWTSFRYWLAGVMTGGVVDPNDPNTPLDPNNPDGGLLPSIPGDDPENPDDAFSIADLITGIIKALWKLVSGIFKVLLGGVVGFFTFVSDSITAFFDIFAGLENPFDTGQYGGTGSVFEFLRAVWSAMPAVIRSLITSVVALFIFLGIFVAIKG